MSAHSLNRRRFLGDSATLLAAGLTVPAFLSATARSMAARPGGGARDGDEPVLVIVQLSGGNDGLNTVIPFENDQYYRARPTLAVNRNNVHPLAGGLALHPVMGAFKELYDDGALAVINNVGYPNPDRSHFRSMDIWHTASTAPGRPESGWIGRLANEHALGDVSGAPYALHLGAGEQPVALLGAGQTLPSVADIESLRWPGDHTALEKRLATARQRANDDLLFVQRVAVASCEQAKRMERAAPNGGGQSRKADYPGYGLAGRLSQIAQLISNGFGARVYYTGLGGFDTHARQALAHGPLLQELSQSVGAFMKDIRARGLGRRVLVMTFSEFGRRVDENGSRGTDHGAAAPMFLIGDAVKPGLHGGTPNLGEGAVGDVAHEIDFRSVYSTVMRDWLSVDAAPILGGRFGAVPCLRG